MTGKRILILGGTSEAMALARALADGAKIDAVMSLAGRTSYPVLPPIPHRIGGFGGVDGLVAYLEEQSIAAVIDATHPFAAQMTRNAALACAKLGVPRAVFTRAAWHPGEGDQWISVTNTEAAVEALGNAPRKVFLTVGRLSLPAFKQAPQHSYLMRSIDAPDAADRPPQMELILARGPFDVDAEIELMIKHGIDIVVTKNSGGNATDAKLAAARALQLPVIMIERPTMPESRLIEKLDDVMDFIKSHNPTP
jgi:precorrin-6A/cobalt-precorrin-6A reductase